MIFSSRVMTHEEGRKSKHLTALQINRTQTGSIFAVGHAN